MIGLPLLWPMFAVSTGVVVLGTALSWYLSRRFYLNGIKDLVRNKATRWDEMVGQHERNHMQARRNTEMRKKYGWFWWLKRAYRKTESA
jgi:hypothetical protein